MEDEWLRSGLDLTRLQASSRLLSALCRFSSVPLLPLVNVEALRISPARPTTAQRLTSLRQASASPSGLQAKDRIFRSSAALPSCMDTMLASGGGNGA